MKAGLASMLLAAKALKLSEIQLKGDLILTGVIDEEVMGRGAKELSPKGISADMTIVAEPTELIPIRAHKGLVFFEISTIGKAIHSSRVSSKGDKGEVNAIYQMCKVLTKIQEHLINLENKVDTLVGNPTISVGTIIGGSNTNVVPDKCSITVDRRLLPNESVEDAKDEMKKILQQLNEEDPRIKTDLKIITSRRGAITNPDEPIVLLSKEAAEEILEKNVEVTGSSATSDMEVFVNQDNTPTVLLGPGSLGMAHITDEFVEINQVVNAAKIFVIVALKALG
jgi:acetylornithine deacetylase/succinyl-diaminopimelate desuccinylase-like protein